MTDVINGAWILARLDKRHGAKSAMADAIGIERTKFTKVLKDQRDLRPEEIARVIDYFAQRGPATTPADTLASELPGFAEGDVAPLLPATKEREKQLLHICRSLAPSAAHPSLSRASRDMISFALMAGDFLVVDLQPHPKQGDLAICQLYDEDHGHAISLIRQYLPPFYVTRDGSSDHAVISETDPNLRLAATLVASFRAPELAS